MANRSLAELFKDYEPYHQTRGNKICHLLGIPILMVSILGLLSIWVIYAPSETSLFRVDGGTILLLIATLWYLSKDWRIGIPFLGFALGTYFAGRASSLPVLAALFILGWVFQLAGHGIYEKKSPAFTQNVEHFLVGPVWVFAWLVGYRPKSRT